MPLMIPALLQVELLAEQDSSAASEKRMGELLAELHSKDQVPC